MRALSLIAVFTVGLAMTGCSSSGSGPNADAYVGSWTFQSGTIVPMCSTIMLGNIDLTGDAVAITKIDGSHVAMVINGGGVMCDVRFTVDGNSAKADSGQTCAISDSGVNAVVNVSSWTLSLSGSQIDMSMSGSTSVTELGITITCAPTSTGTMVRSGSDAAQSG